jgi:hypothetical protein
MIALRQRSKPQQKSQEYDPYATAEKQKNLSPDELRGLAEEARERYDGRRNAEVSEWMFRIATMLETGQGVEIGVNGTITLDLSRTTNNERYPVNAPTDPHVREQILRRMKDAFTHVRSDWPRIYIDELPPTKVATETL